MRERERVRERVRERESEKERARKREREKARERKKEREKKRERERDRGREREKEREKEREQVYILDISIHKWSLQVIALMYICLQVLMLLIFKKARIVHKYYMFKDASKDYLHSYRLTLMWRLWQLNTSPWQPGNRKL